MAYVDPIDLDLFKLGDLGTLQARDVTDAIVSFSTSLSISGSSEVKVGIVDPDFAMASANYFQIRRDIFYRNLWFEIAAVETMRSESIHPLYNLECRSKGVQLMKRDKKPEAYRGMSGFEFAKKVAKDFKLNFVGQQATKKQSVVKGKSKDADDSVWTVLQSLASEQQFICFESEGTLFFCSEKFLLGKWGSEKYKFGEARFIPFFWPETDDPVFLEARDQYQIIDQPNIRRSDDDIRAAEGTMLVDRLNGVHLRPGMTIWLGGIPDFESFYIITDVSFEEGVPDPVQVSFRVPLDPKKESISTKGTKASTTTTGNTGQSNAIGNPPSDPGNPTGSGQTRFLTAKEAKAYTADALSRLNYKGSNGNLINGAVQRAVNQLNNKVPLAEIEKRINQTPAVTVSEKSIIFKIYSYYALGFPATALGVAGGVNDSVVAEKKTDLEYNYKPDTANKTPDSSTTRPPGSQASTSNFEQSTSTLTGVGSLPQQVTKEIKEFVKTRSRGLVQSEIDLVTQLALQDAVLIYKISATGQKISKYAYFYNLAKTDPKYSVAMRRLRYQAIRIKAVYSQIDRAISESDLVNAGAFAQV